MKARLPGGVEITFPQVLLIAAIVFFALAIPGDLDYKLDALGFGVCHQIDTHSYFVGGHQLPLCSRCSGIYLGALAALALLMVLRRRALRFPTKALLGLLAVFFLAMVFDGINSTLQFLGSGIWVTTNLLRLITGALAGVALAFMLYPAFNLSMWHPEAGKKERVLEQPFELIAYMVAAGVLVALVLDGADWLYYPLAYLSIAGMLALLTMANTMGVLMVLGREGEARTFSMALTPLLAGFLIALIQITLLAWGRASLAPYMSNDFGLPLVPGLP